MGGQQTRFLFLSDEDFWKLDPDSRAAYLVRAQQEITDRQRVLRDQMRQSVMGEKPTGPAPPSRP